MSFYKIPQNYAPGFVPQRYTFINDAAAATLTARLTDTRTAESVAELVLRDLWMPEIDVSAFLRRMAAAVPFETGATGLYAPTTRTMTLSLAIGSDKAPDRIFLPATRETRSGEPLTSLPEVRLIGAEETDEVSVHCRTQCSALLTATCNGIPTQRTYGVAAEGVALFRLAAAEFPDAEAFDLHLTADGVESPAGVAQRGGRHRPLYLSADRRATLRDRKAPPAARRERIHPDGGHRRGAAADRIGLRARRRTGCAGPAGRCAGGMGGHRGGVDGGRRSERFASNRTARHAATAVAGNSPPAERRAAMIRLRIDSVVCDLAAEQPLTLAWSGRTLTDPEAGRSGEALTFELLPTAAAEALFGAECHLYGAGRFNAALHRGELLAGGTPLASGSVRLVETLWHGTEHRYRVELRGGAHAWAEQAAKGWFRELEVAYEGRLLPTEIAAGWSDDSPVKFLPVYRDRYEIENGDAGLRPPERLLSTDDYHPFLSIRALVQALFAKAGYTVESAFMESPWFRSLYMSGAYASHDTRVRQQKMGFLARRKADRTTTANALGRVEANPFVTHNTVGNLVDAFSPQEVDETGATLTDAYSAGGCLRIEEGELCFRPLTEVSVGFEYELRYTTDYRIRSRTRLTGFDSVWLGEDADVRFELANRFEDRREALRPSFQYRIVVFDHTEGNRWTLRCTTDGAETTLTDFTTRSTLFTTPQGTTLVNARLYRNVSGVYVPYTEDWALYDGYIGETGRTEVQITVRTSPESVTPTAPKYFRQISFYGAEEGMNFTISRRCRLRPCFSSAPGYGAALAFDDVARHEIRQAELLRALAHLFDLRFHTDEQLKRVYIEPACEFYDATTVWEWSGRILGDTPIAGADRALDVHDRRTWGYRDADGAVARFDAANDTRFGRWSHATASKAAKQGEEVSLNELVAPTLCEAGRYANAPSALILCVGDRDDATTDDATAVTPRIVRWMGLHGLPAGERWGYPLGDERYPLAAFHFTGDAETEGFTLCFEDRDAQEGLHRFYDARIAAEEDRQQVTLRLRIAPDEYAALFRFAGEAHPTIRSRFRFRFAGGSSLFTLRAVEAYDPREGVAHCTFDRLCDD